MFSKFFFKPFVNIPVAPNITVIIIHRVATRPNSSITKYFSWGQYCNFSEAQTVVGSVMMV